MLDTCLTIKFCSAPAATVGSGLAAHKPFPEWHSGSKHCGKHRGRYFKEVAVSGAKPLHSCTLGGSTIQRMGLETHAAAGVTCFLPSRKPYLKASIKRRKYSESLNKGTWCEQQSGLGSKVPGVGAGCTDTASLMPAQTAQSQLCQGSPQRAWDSLHLPATNTGFWHNNGNCSNNATFAYPGRMNHCVTMTASTRGENPRPLYKNHRLV